MAIDDHPDIRCQHLAHRTGQEPPAVAVVRHHDSLNGRWWAWCNPHVDYATADPDPVPYDVAYLDPARQRRPSYVRVQSADDQPGTAGPYLPATHHP
jgi:hypothetical protein